MKVKYVETAEDKKNRDSVLFNTNIAIIPVICIILIIGLILSNFTGIDGDNSYTEKYGKGNPYNCIVCKNSGKACKEHRNYDSYGALKIKVTKFVNRYKANGSENSSLNAIYEYGAEYNQDCDFCLESREECYSCKFDREYIESKYNECIISSYFDDNICDQCKYCGYINCELCKEMVAKYIMDSVKIQEVE